MLQLVSEVSEFPFQAQLWVNSDLHGWMICGLFPWWFISISWSSVPAGPLWGREINQRRAWAAVVTGPSICRPPLSPPQSHKKPQDPHSEGGPRLEASPHAQTLSIAVRNMLLWSKEKVGLRAFLRGGRSSSVSRQGHILWTAGGWITQRK